MRLLREIPARLLCFAVLASQTPIVPAYAVSSAAQPEYKVAKLLPQAPQLDYLEPEEAPDKVLNNYGADSESVNTAPDASKSILVQAVQKYSAGNIVEAEVLFRKVLSQDPDNADAQYNLGAIAEQQGRLPEALIHYQAAVKTNPQDKDFAEAARSVSEKLQVARAESQKQQVAQHQQQQQQNQHMRQKALEAKSAYQAGNYDQAIQKLSSLKGAQDPDVEFGLSQAYKAKNNLGQARYHLTNAMALDPENETYKQAYASLTEEFKRTQDQVADAGAPPGEIVPMNGGGNEQMGRFKTADRKTRLFRAVGASAAGAALGAIMGGITNKYDRRGGALRGAVYGGAMGLMLGGFTGR